MKVPEDVDRKVAQWWADRLGDKYEDKREEFQEELYRRLYSIPWTRISVDYDPDPILRGALNAVGIECSGVMFSARDILPGKTTVLKRAGGTVETKEGYGAPWRVL